jgi:AraC-like DNA-binding protein
MTWSGEFVFGAAWAAFRGQAADNSLHSHAALQLTLAEGEEVTLTDAAARRFSGKALLTRPATMHALMPINRVTLILIDPHTPLAGFFLDQVGPSDIELLPGGMDRLLAREGPIANCLDRIAASVPAQRELDPRLAGALQFLIDSAHRATVSDAAAANGLSTSRLRLLARRQLRLPLSSWQTWNKLERAAQELATGAGLAEAALAGGFADQAHFTRTMRKVFGITPTTANKLLR